MPRAGKGKRNIWRARRGRPTWHRGRVHNLWCDFPTTALAEGGARISVYTYIYIYIYIYILRSPPPPNRRPGKGIGRAGHPPRHSSVAHPYPTTQPALVELAVSLLQRPGTRCSGDLCAGGGRSRPSVKQSETSAGAWRCHFGHMRSSPAPSISLATWGLRRGRPGRGSSRSLVIGDLGAPT